MSEPDELEKLLGDIRRNISENARFLADLKNNRDAGEPEEEKDSGTEDVPEDFEEL